MDFNLSDLFTLVYGLMSLAHAFHVLWPVACKIVLGWPGWF